MNKEKQIFKAGLWYTIGNILVKAVNFLALPIFTNLMTTREYGIFGTYQAYEIIFSVVVSLGVSGTIRAAYNDYKNNFEKYVTSITTPIILITIIMLFCDGGIAFFFKKIELFFYGLALILNCMGNAFREIFSQKYVVQNKYKQNLIMSLAISVLNISFSYVFCMSIFQTERHFSRIWGACLSAFIVAVIMYILQLKQDRTIVWPKAWKFSLLLGLPLIFHQLSLSILGQCDKIMIQNQVGLDAAGIYSSMTTIILVPQVIMHSFDNAWAGWFFTNISKCSSDTSQQEIRDLNNKLVITFMLVMMGFSLISHEIVRFMVGAEYREGVTILYILSVSVFANFLYIFAVNVEYYTKNTKMIAVYTVISAFFNIAFNYILILLIGYVGAAFATLASRLILLYLHTKQSRRLINYDVLGNNVIFVSLFLIAAVSAFSFVFDSVFLVRLIAFIIVVGIGLIYIYKKFINAKVREIK